MLRGPAEMRGVNGCHKDAQPMMEKGIMINVAHYMEDVDEKWANQCSIYGWLLGEPVGSQFVIGVDQLAIGANPDFKDRSKPPAIRIAKHRCRASADHQKDLYLLSAMIWKIIHSGWIFRSMTEEASKQRQSMLDQVHKAYGGEGPNEEWFESATRQHSNF